jgi:hypothetical protein
VGNRPLGGCVFGERSKPKTEGAEYASAKPKRPKRKADWLPMRFGDPTVGEYADATAWQSVAYLTITNAKKLVWYNEGGMPAFQSAPRSGSVIIFWGEEEIGNLLRVGLNHLVNRFIDQDYLLIKIITQKVW